MNPHAAIDYLNRIKTADPSYTDADKELGDIYYKLDNYAEAIKSYAAYYAATPKEAGKIDIASCESYLQALFSMSAKDETNLDKMIEIADVLKPLAPNDILIPRMEFFAKFNKVETSMDYEGALAAADTASSYIKNKQFADSVYFYMDYDFAAKLCKEQGNMPEAIKYYELAVKDLEDKAPSITDERRLKRIRTSAVLTTTRSPTSTFATNRQSKVSQPLRSTSVSWATRPTSPTVTSSVPNSSLLTSKRTTLPRRSKSTSTKPIKPSRQCSLQRPPTICLRYSLTSSWLASTTPTTISRSTLYATTTSRPSKLVRKKLSRTNPKPKRTFRSLSLPFLLLRKHRHSQQGRSYEVCYYC